MKVYKTSDAQVQPSVVLLTYGEAGVGKSTFAATSLNPIIADCENGYKYFGLRGIAVDVARIEKWADMKDFLEIAKSNKYETIVIDPIGELMEKLVRFMIAGNDSKLVQKDSTPTMAGWGFLKKTLRDYIKILRDTGKHVILVAHMDEIKDEDRLLKRPKIQTKLSDELVALVDIVGYFTVVNDQGIQKRVIVVDPSNDKITAKDRTGQLGKYIEPDFQKIVNACQGTEKYAWSKSPKMAPTETLPPKTSDIAPPPKISTPAPKSVATDESIDELDKAFGVQSVETIPPPLENPHLQAAREKLKAVTKK